MHCLKTVWPVFACASLVYEGAGAGREVDEAKCCHSCQTFAAEVLQKCADTHCRNQHACVGGGGGGEGGKVVEFTCACMVDVVVGVNEISSSCIYNTI